MPRESQTGRKMNWGSYLERVTSVLEVTETLATWAPDENGFVLWFLWRESIHIQALREITRPGLMPSPRVLFLSSATKTTYHAVVLSISAASSDTNSRQKTDQRGSDKRSHQVFNSLWVLRGNPFVCTKKVIFSFEDVHLLNICFSFAA